MAQSDGFNDATHPDYVLQATTITLRAEAVARMWNKTIDDFVLGLELKKRESDHCVYMKRDGQGMIFVALYVDDLILANSTSKMLQETKQVLSNRFEMADMVQINYFLGIEIGQDTEAGGH